jgi:hypothetical protein
LGHREFYFTDLKQEEQSGSFQDSDTYSALLAAWVTYADEPVARLASLANKRAGGAAASLDEKQCIAAMKECYDLMRDIKITYQTPPFSSEPGKDYEPVGIQALQFPRDTIEKRSGTCIDLAILYAAMIKSIGITPYLVSKDGHCFPMGVTPNGQIIAVEATCVRGGADSDNFDKAVQIGAKEWQEVNKTGRFNLVKLDELWGSGISPPELEHMPADILERWNISDMVLKGQRPGPAPVVETNNVAPVALAAGNWTFTTSWPNGGATRGTAMFVVNGKQVQIVATATYLVLGYDNLQHKAFEQDTFNGILTGTNLAAQCNNLVATLDGQNVPPQGLPFVLKMVVGNDGKSAHGTVTNAMGNSGQVTMNAQ